ncbi:MAG: translation initiation factor IF-5A, partial [Desulfurococcaceae archaeon]
VSKDSVDEAIRDKLTTGMEVEYWLVMNTRILVRPR